MQKFLVLLSCLLLTPCYGSEPKPVPYAPASDHEREQFVPVGRLFAGNLLFAHPCTATLVAPSFAVTARHCVTNPLHGEPVTELTGAWIEFTLDNGQSSRVTRILRSDEEPYPYREYWGRPSFVVNVHRDIVLLELEKDLGTANGFIPLEDSDPFVGHTEEFQYILVGYPAKDDGEQTKIKQTSNGSCDIVALDDFENGRYRPVQRLIQSSCLASPGFSGAPLIKTAADGRQTVLGVLSSPLHEGGRPVGSLIIPAYNQSFLNFLRLRR